MPRPTDLDPELFAKWEEELTQVETNPPPGTEHLYVNPVVKAKLHEIGLANKWLKLQLESAGVEPEKVERFSSAFAQRCFLAPDVWELAGKVVELFKKGKEASPPVVYVTRDMPEDERAQLFEKYTKVHPR